MKKSNFSLISYLLLLITFSLFFNSAFSNDQEDWDESRRRLEEGLSSDFAPGINYSNYCSSCLDDSNNYPKVILDSPTNSKKIKLSLLTENDLGSLTKEISENEDIPFGYIVDGCYARSHAVARLLDQKGIISGKIFLEGELYFDSKKFDTTISWSYHVANLVMIKKNGKNIPMVIDPAIKKTPMTIEEWKNFFLKHKKTKIKESYFQSRFAYDSDDKNSDLVDYNREELKNAQYKNQEHAKILYMYEKTFK